VSVITGGARGLGKAMAYALAQVGSNIVIADLQLDQAQQTADEIQENEGVMTKPYFEGNEGMVKQWMELTPMRRPGNPEELGGLAVYLASDASSYVTGGVHTIDGGYTIW
ncbi:SDR family oxidoreductase, partial [Paenibacillus alkaliterrae]